MKLTFSVFNDMKTRSIIPTQITYTHLLQSCLNSSSTSIVAQANKVRNMMLRRNLEIHPFHYNLMLAIATKAGDVGLATQFFRELPEKSTMSYITLLRCLATRGGDTNYLTAMQYWTEILRKYVQQQAAKEGKSYPSFVEPSCSTGFDDLRYSDSVAFDEIDEIDVGEQDAEAEFAEQQNTGSMQSYKRSESGLIMPASSSSDEPVEAENDAESKEKSEPVFQVANKPTRTECELTLDPRLITAVLLACNNAHAMRFKMQGFDIAFEMFGLKSIRPRNHGPAYPGQMHISDERAEAIIQSPPLVPTVYNINALLQICLDTRSIDVAIDLFYEMYERLPNVAGDSMTLTLMSRILEIRYKKSRVRLILDTRDKMRVSSVKWSAVRTRVYDYVKQLCNTKS